MNLTFITLAIVIISLFFYNYRNNLKLPKINHLLIVSIILVIICALYKQYEGLCLNAVSTNQALCSQYDSDPTSCVTSSRCVVSDDTIGTLQNPDGTYNTLVNGSD